MIPTELLDCSGDGLTTEDGEGIGLIAHAKSPQVPVLDISFCSETDKQTLYLSESHQDLHTLDGDWDVRGLCQTNPVL